eukprot:SAG22_NODE_589_length_8828_cov_4.479895_4_plen_300_part_00
MLCTGSAVTPAAMEDAVAAAGGDSAGSECSSGSTSDGSASSDDSSGVDDGSSSDGGGADDLSQRLRQAGAEMVAGNWPAAVAGYLTAVRALAPQDHAGCGRLCQLAADGLCMALHSLTAELPAPGARLGALQQALQLLPASGAAAAAAGLLRQIGSEHAAAARFGPAIDSLRRSAELARANGGDVDSAEECLQHVLGSAVPRWHFRMLNDGRRNRAYAAAIERAVHAAGGGDGLTVVDIGAGTGLLGEPQMAMQCSGCPNGRPVQCRAPRLTPLHTALPQGCLPQGLAPRQCTPSSAPR